MTVADVLRWTVLALSVPAAVYDLRERRVPNFISLPALAAGIALALFGGTDVATLTVIPVLLVAWSAGWIGGGDAKMLVALGLAFGAGPVAAIVALAGLAALAARRPMPGAALALPVAAAVEVLRWLRPG